MKQMDFLRYTTILLEVYALQDSLRNNPPDEPAEYVALVARIQALWNEAAALTSSGDLSSAQIAELRETGNRLNSKRSRPNEPAQFRYNELLTTAPDESQLRAADEIYGNDKDSPSQWIVWGGFGRKPSGPGWFLLKTIR